MGHSVTVLYEIKPNTNSTNGNSSRYTDTHYNEELKNELATIRIRYKKPNSSNSLEMNSTIRIDDKDISKDDFIFAQTVAGFGMILRDSKFKEDLTIEKLIELAKTSKGEDKEGYRREFIELMKKADSMIP
jgi:Ca-activated chloride channel family protein